MHLESEVVGEAAAAEKIQEYFRKVPVAEAMELYSVFNIPLAGARPEYLWSAPWWVGYQMVQPGSASGTSSQEIWHQVELKEAVSSTYRSPWAVVQDLNARGMDYSHLIF